MPAHVTRDWLWPLVTSSVLLVEMANTIALKVVKMASAVDQVANKNSTALHVLVQPQYMEMAAELACSMY